MSSTQTTSEPMLATTSLGFKMERTNSETNPRLGRSPYRSFDAAKVVQCADDQTTTEPVQVLLHVDEDNKNTKIREDISEVGIPTPTRAMKTIPLVRTPSIPIAMTPGSRSMSRAREVALAARERTPTGLPDQPLVGKAKRKKKKAQKVAAAADPAMRTVRGFTPTRVPSSDGDSDFSPNRFQRRDVSIAASLASSPLMRPVSRAGSVTGGISAHRQQLDALELESNSKNLSKGKSSARSVSPCTPGATTGSGSVSDIEPPEMESYEVPLESDFVSQDIENNESDPLSPQMDIDVMHRKMSATDFTPLTCLGKGTFGTVHLVKQRATGRLFAQKMFRKASLTLQKTLIEQTKTERAILESINRHPFVVKLYYAFQDQEKLYLILEYAQGGEIFTHLATERMFSEETASFYMAELVLALEHLHHTVGVVYRDLKPENCLLDADGHLLLTDFGLSKVAVDDTDRCTSILGTIDYMAPEVILGHTYDKAVDWWSFGALGYDLLTGGPPFEANNHAKTKEKIVRSKLSLPYFLSPDAKDLLTRLLRKEPRKRLGGNMPKDMQTIKKHRFFKKIDWKRLEKRELEPPIKPLVTDPALAENFSQEFTSLALSPVVEAHPLGQVPWDIGYEETNPFGGFSFVASKSLLASEGFMGMED